MPAPVLKEKITRNKVGLRRRFALQVSRISPL